MQLISTHPKKNFPYVQKLAGTILYPGFVNTNIYDIIKVNILHDLGSLTFRAFNESLKLQNLQETIRGLHNGDATLKWQAPVFYSKPFWIIPLQRLHTGY